MQSVINPSFWMRQSLLCLEKSHNTEIISEAYYINLMMFKSQAFCMHWFRHIRIRHSEHRWWCIMTAESLLFTNNRKWPLSSTPITSRVQKHIPHLFKSERGEKISESFQKRNCCFFCLWKLAFVPNNSYQSLVFLFICLFLDLKSLPSPD